MGSKLLFVLGIVAAHSALAAAWVKQESPHQRVSSVSCIHLPDAALPDLTPRSEIYAAAFLRVDSLNEVMRP
jgi:hypothetical protein